MAKLNVGGGKGHPKLPGWTIVDLRDSADLVLDISSQRLPFEDGSVDVVFTSHTLEHILPQKLGFVMDEFRRVLKPGRRAENGFTGGILRIAVPDITLAIKAYSAGDRSFFDKSEVTVRDREAPIGGLLASWFYSISAVGNGHVHCFDEPYMTYWLNKHGFNHVARSRFQASLLPELRTDAFDRHPHDSLYIEAWHDTLSGGGRS